MRRISGKKPIKIRIAFNQVAQAELRKTAEANITSLAFERKFIGKFTSIKHSVSLIKDQGPHPLESGPHIIFREIVVQSTRYDKSVTDILKRSQSM